MKSVIIIGSRNGLLEESEASTEIAELVLGTHEGRKCVSEVGGSIEATELN